MSRKVFQLIAFMRKLFIKNTVPRTNTTQLHQLGVSGSAESSPNGVRGGAPEALALTAFSLTKRRICKLYWFDQFRRSWGCSHRLKQILLGKIESLWQNQNLASQKHPFSFGYGFDQCRRQTMVKRRSKITKGGALKSPQILQFKNLHSMGDKIRTFCSSTVGVGKITGSEGGGSRAWRFKKKKKKHFKHFLIQGFSWSMILNYCSMLVRT